MRGPRTLLSRGVMCGIVSALAGAVLPARCLAGTADDNLTAIRELIDQGQYSRAAEVARERLAVAESTYGPEAVETADLLDLLATALWRGGKAREPEALQAAERAVSIKAQALGAGTPGYARSLQIQGHVLLSRGDPPAAKGLFEKALALFEATLGPEHLDVAGALNSLAIAYRHGGDYAAARPLVERALGIRERLAPDSREVAQSCNTLGAVLWNLGDYEGSRASLERALSIFEKVLGTDHPQVASLRNNLGTLLRDMGEFEAARSHLERAAAIHESLDPDGPELALSLGNLASVLSDLGDFGRAIDLRRRALPIQEKALGPEHPEVAASLSNLAQDYQRLRRPDEARPLLERSLAIRRKVLGPEHPDTAWTTENLARVYQDIGLLAEARPLYERALAVREKALGPEHPHLAWTLDGLGRLLAQQGELAEAVACYERGRAIRLKALGPAHPLTAEITADLSQVRFQAGDRRAAMEEALEAERTAREHLRATARSLTERQTLCYEDRRASGIALALSVLVAGEGRDATARVWDELVRSRGLVMDLAAARHRAVMEHPSPAIASLVADLEAARDRLSRLVVRGPDLKEPQAYLGALRLAQEEKEKAEQALAAASTAFQEERARSAAGLTEVAASLPEQSALVAYVRYDRRPPPTADHRGLAKNEPAYLALILARRGATPVLLDLGPGARIEALVRRWREEVIRPPDGLEAIVAYRKAGGELRQAIWDPLTSHLREARSVLIVPDGALQLVSFATLPTGTDRYLVETGPRLHYLSAERDLLEAGRPAPSGGGLLVLGGPDFDAPPTDSRVRNKTHGTTGVATALRSVGFRGASARCADFRSLRFEALPSALMEADEVESLWRARHRGGDALKLTGRRASEEAFKAQSAGRSILHLATHGFLVGDACQSWQVESSAQSCQSAADEGMPLDGENPLLLSGLALAGANRREGGIRDSDVEDGILTAEEIASLDLRGVDWVVLSGCDTGLGRIRPGEGVFGLRRTFRVAGARTLVMSLWAVEDHAAREWIRNLYGARLGGRSTVESVRRATLSLLEAYRRTGASPHPFFWGSFVAAGDWR